MQETLLQFINQAEQFNTSCLAFLLLNGGVVTSFADNGKPGIFCLSKIYG